MKCVLWLLVIVAICMNIYSVVMHDWPLSLVSVAILAVASIIHEIHNKPNRTS